MKLGLTHTNAEQTSKYFLQLPDTTFNTRHSPPPKWGMCEQRSINPITSEELGLT